MSSSSIFYNSDKIQQISKVFPSQRRHEILDKLANPHPTHYERLWLVGFLKFVGYSKEEVLEILKVHAKWDEFDDSISWYQICTIYKEKAPLPHQQTRRKSNRKNKNKKRSHHGIKNPYHCEQEWLKFRIEHNLPEWGGSLNLEASDDWIGVPNPAGFILEWRRRVKKDDQ